MVSKQELQSLRNMGNECEVAADEIERLTAENAALRGDIEITQARYRWCAFELFAHNYGSSTTNKGWVAYGWRRSPRVFEVPTIDEAVDAARKEKP
jgi:hypothetical protein